MRALGFRAIYEGKKIVLLKNRSRKISPKVSLKDMSKKDSPNFKNKQIPTSNHISASSYEGASFSNLKALLKS